MGERWVGMERKRCNESCIYLRQDRCFSLSIFYERDSEWQTNRKQEGTGGNPVSLGWTDSCGLHGDADSSTSFLLRKAPSALSPPGSLLPIRLYHHWWIKIEWNRHIPSRIGEPRCPVRSLSSCSKIFQSNSNSLILSPCKTLCLY